MAPGVVGRDPAGGAKEGRARLGRGGQRGVLRERASRVHVELERGRVSAAVFERRKAEFGLFRARRPWAESEFLGRGGTGAGGFSVAGAASRGGPSSGGSERGGLGLG